MKSQLNHIQVHDGLLDTDVIGRLRREVISLCLLGKTALRWYPFGNRPQTLFEHVIESLRSHVAHADDCIGAEWWFRMQAADSGFQWHFDRDEAVRKKVVSPHISSILYLSHVGGPTLIMDIEPTMERKKAPQEGIAVFPRPGRFARFPGTLFHGVSTGSPSRWPRVAMYVNWWGRKPLAPLATTANDALHMSPRPKRPILAADRRGRPVPLKSFLARDVMSTAQWRRLVESAGGKRIKGY